MENTKMLQPAFPYVLLIKIVSVLLLVSGCAGNGGEREGAARVDTSSDSLTLVMSSEDSVSVLDLLRRHHEADIRSSALGSFVTAIDSIENGGGAFWVYSVNADLPQTAADNYMVGPKDTVRWHFRRAGP